MTLVWLILFVTLTLGWLATTLTTYTEPQPDFILDGVVFAIVMTCLGILAISIFVNLITKI